MARIEFALKAHLAADAAIAARVASRIYPLVIPQDASPTGDKLTYQRKSGPRNFNLTGGNDWSKAEFDVVAWSLSYDNAKLLADDVRNRMHGWAQDDFGSGAGAVKVGFVKLINEEDGYYDPEDGSDNGWFAVVSTYQINYLEPAPEF